MARFRRTKFHQKRGRYSHKQGRRSFFKRASRKLRRRRHTNPYKRAAKTVNKFKRIYSKRNFWKIPRPLNNPSFSVRSFSEHSAQIYTLASINTANGIIGPYMYLLQDCMLSVDLTWIKAKYAECQLLSHTCCITLEDTNALVQYTNVGIPLTNYTIAQVSPLGYEPDIGIITSNSATGGYPSSFSEISYYQSLNNTTTTNRKLWLSGSKVQLLRPFKRIIRKWNIAPCNKGEYQSTASLVLGSSLATNFTQTTASNEPQGYVGCFFDVGNFLAATSGPANSITIGIQQQITIALRGFIPQ